MEIWKKHPVFENYIGSNLGNVKSLDYKHTGNECLLKKRTIVKHRKHKDYIQQQISLYNHNKRKFYYVHRFIYECFNGLIPQGLQIDHINNNTQDNRLQNLQLLTPSENCKKRFIDNPHLSKSYIHNLQKIHPKTKIICLNNNQIYESQREAARKLNISNKHVNDVLKGRRNHTHGYKFRYIDVFSIDERPNSALAVLKNERN